MRVRIVKQHWADSQGQTLRETDTCVELDEATAHQLIARGFAEPAPLQAAEAVAEADDEPEGEVTE